MALVKCFLVSPITTVIVTVLVLKIVGGKVLMLLRLTYDHTVSPPGDLRTRPSSNDVTPVDKDFFFSSHILVNQPVLTKKTVLISDSREDQGRADIVGTHLRLSQQLRQAKESKSLEVTTVKRFK